ncbi:hypothetical protein B0H11DRAFT_185144 [Mycena galericulata]|nr:hypothetical protein B0H11DRAFT_185144 [Mycena galericulata]
MPVLNLFARTPSTSVAHVFSIVDISTTQDVAHMPYSVRVIPRLHGTHLTALAELVRGSGAGLCAPPSLPAYHISFDIDTTRPPRPLCVPRMSGSRFPAATRASLSRCHAGTRTIASIVFVTSAFRRSCICGLPVHLRRRARGQRAACVTLKCTGTRCAAGTEAVAIWTLGLYAD